MLRRNFSLLLCLLAIRFAIAKDKPVIFVVDDSAVERELIELRIANKHPDFEWVICVSLDEARVRFPEYKDRIVMALIDKDVPVRHVGIPFALEIKKALPNAEILLHTSGDLDDKQKKLIADAGVVYTRKGDNDKIFDVIKVAGDRCNLKKLAQ